MQHRDLINDEHLSFAPVALDTILPGDVSDLAIGGSVAHPNPAPRMDSLPAQVSSCYTRRCRNRNRNAMRPQMRNVLIYKVCFSATRRTGQKHIMAELEEVKCF